MEDISPIYEDVDIRVWAQDIHLSKTRELEELINDHIKYMDDSDQYFYPERYLYIVREEIYKLQRKLDVLKRK